MPEYYCVIFKSGEGHDFTHPQEITGDRNDHYDRVKGEFSGRFVDIVYRNSPTEALRAARDFEEQPF
ncbi:MAG: hypothetical protein HY517_02595 [Candidatus Aenigmarchaeota archaeon]|nr:hypothetical protein [Candidatus Aenigmarchaeota archaeon]